MEQTTREPHEQPAPATEGETSETQHEQVQPLSKNALKKAAKEAEKARKKAETNERIAVEKASAQTEPVDYSKGKYGVIPLIQSTQRTGEKRTKISEINASLDGSEIALRARVHNLRLQGSKMVFFELRQEMDTIQALLVQSANEVSKQMYKFAASISPESIILVKGTIKKSPIEINATTVKDVELHIAQIWVISASAPRLPFQLEDAQRPETEEESSRVEEQEHTDTDSVAPSLESGKKIVRVALPTRLNNRVIDLRTTTSHAIFRIQSGACSLFREFLLSKNFVEIHTPKLLAAASEGGANVFKVTYFDRSAYLAQSPQLYKQMLITSDFERVFEIAPVFRAENSFTHRHLTEFVGLDLEMAFEEHYHEVLELIEEMFMFIFRGFETRYSKEIETVRKQFPFVKPFELPEDGKVVRLTYSEGISLLRESGEEIEDYADMSYLPVQNLCLHRTPQEKALGKLVKEKYHTDYYVLDKFPLAIRPFYTMPDPVNPKYSNSYDMFCRGEEIISGAQRIHDPELLAERIKAQGIEIKGGLEDYVNAFKYGAMPHAGGGIGLERLVMLYLGIGNIRRASLFPRDPRRIEP